MTKADPGLDSAAAFEVTDCLEGGRTLVAKVVSPAPLVTALGLVDTDSRADGRCNGTLLPAGAALFEDGWRNRLPAFLIMVVWAEGACFAALSTGSGMANVVSATATAMDEPSDAAAPAARDSVATTNESTIPGNDSSGVHGVFLEACVAILEDVCCVRTSPVMVVSILVNGASFTAVSTGGASGMTANVVSATAKPFDASVSVAWDPATVKDSPSTGNGSEARVPTASAALLEDCSNDPAPIIMASILANEAVVSAGRISEMANVASGVGEPSNATVSVVGDSLVMTKDSPRAGSGGGGVLSRLPSVALSEAWSPVAPFSMAEGDNQCSALSASLPAPRSWNGLLEGASSRAQRNRLGSNSLGEATLR